MSDETDEAVSDGDGETEAAPPETPSESMTPEVEAAPDEPVENPEKKALHEEAKRHRIRAKQEKEKREALEAELQAQRAKLEQVQESLGISPSNGDGDGDAPDPVEKARQQTERAKQAFIRAEFTQAALDAGVRSDRIDAAWKLAKDDLGSVEVDLESGEVAGVSEVAQRVVDDMPELTRKEAPKVDRRKPGGPKGPSIDLSDVQRGDVRRLSTENPDEFDRLVREGVVLVTHYEDGNGNPIKVPITKGGSAFANKFHEIRQRARKRRQVDSD